jgi:hypothetical protein
MEETTGWSSAFKPVMDAPIKLYESAKSTLALPFPSMRAFPAFEVIPPGTMEPPAKCLVVDLELVRGSEHLSQQCRTIVGVLMLVECQHTGTDRLSITSIRGLPPQTMDQPSIALLVIPLHQSVDLTLAESQILRSFTIGHLVLLDLNHDL